MILAIDTASAVPPYEQLREQIAALITSGSLRAEDRIPPIRQLARDLGLAPGTVNRAMRELESDGWLESRGHRGTFVRANRPNPDKALRAASITEAARKYALSVKQLGVDRGEAIETFRTELAKLEN